MYHHFFGEDVYITPIIYELLMHITIGDDNGDHYDILMGKCYPLSIFKGKHDSVVSWVSES